MSIPVRSRRAQAVDETIRQTGIDEDMIGRLVDAFYSRVRSDAVLAPIFKARVSDWDEHLATMRRFWSAVALMTGAYHGEPMAKHAPLPVSGAHFDRWLALFRETTRAVCPPEAADFFDDRAGRIARSLEMGVAVSRGHLLRTGERLSPL
ncbi:MAG: group III truncated hemoglobin [Sphingomonadales bacterium]